MNKKRLKFLLPLLLISLIIMFMTINKEKKVESNEKVTVTKYEIPALNSMSAKEWMEKGIEFGDKKEFLVAKEYFQNGLKIVKDPYEKSEIIYYYGQLIPNNEAVELYKKEIENNTLYSPLYVALMIEYMHNGKTYSEIKDIFESALVRIEKDTQMKEKDKENIRVTEFLLYYNMSNSALRNGQDRDAFYYSFMATKLFKDEYKSFGGEWFSIFLNAAVYYLEKNEYDKAIDSLNKVPEDVDKESLGIKYNILGSVYLGLENYKKSKEAFDKAVGYGDKNASNNLKKLEKYKQEGKIKP